MEVTGIALVLSVLAASDYSSHGKFPKKVDVSNVCLKMERLMLLQGQSLAPSCISVMYY